MPTITAEHLHTLLASTDRGAALVVVEGRAAVVPSGPGRGEGPEDAMVITTRDAVIAELDTGANEEQLEALAQRLDTALDSLGG
ncbi:hypothetical protein GCM10010402_75660 [Actinomadura luteofluorescens]|uniref:Uncharacterized protein n=1 Tax=Actinomadura luteofluorescens TaxID=46163 RepID=A0A7Y9ES70_9ACTN|nr:MULTISPECIES: hypothetical protein [Actinomadura]MCR3739056.1 hypothetical protein [Actinomadura glauciflava]NYD52886.1 hypothetical protein [Actinomadura luteofluorescens]